MIGPEFPQHHELHLRAGVDPRVYWCDTFWGSHGCDRPTGHLGEHACGPFEEEDGEMVLCCTYDGTGVRYVTWTEDGEGWELSEERWPSETFSNYPELAQ